MVRVVSSRLLMIILIFIVLNVGCAPSTQYPTHTSAINTAQTEITGAFGQILGATAIPEASDIYSQRKDRSCVLEISRRNHNFDYVSKIALHPDLLDSTTCIYKFTPVNPYPALFGHFVLPTPITNKIYAIEVVGNKFQDNSSQHACEAEVIRISNVIQKKYSGLINGDETSAIIDIKVLDVERDPLLISTSIVEIKQRSLGMFRVLNDKYRKIAIFCEKGSWSSYFTGNIDLHIQYLDMSLHDQLVAELEELKVSRKLLNDKKELKVQQQREKANF